jgi:cytochrome bd-type quinol oxidase subunit 2
MTRKFKNIAVALSMLCLSAAPILALPAVATAAVNITSGVCSGTNFDISGNGTGCPSTSATSFQGLLDNVVNIFSAIVGVIAVIMIIVGGLRYITSGGDSSRVGAAKTTIIYALVGLVVVVLAQLIVHFVINQATSVTGSGGSGG